jgi:hypothetical protein
MKKNVVIVSIFILCIFTLNLKSDLNLLSWKVYTSLANISEATISKSGKIYAISSGGLFIYNLNQKTSSNINNLNGLWDNNLTAIYLDENNGDIYVGSSSGAISKINENNEVKVILDVYKSTFLDKQINSFIGNGNLLYICTNFGLTVFDKSKNIFVETIMKFGDFSTNSAAIKSLLFNGKIYIITNEGLAIASLNDQLTDPKSWATYPIKGLPGGANFRDILEFNGDIFIASKNYIFKFANDSVSNILNEITEIHNLSVYQNKLYYATDYKLLDLNKYDFPLELKSPTSKIKFFNPIDNVKDLINFNLPLIIYQNAGIAYPEKSTYKLITPNSPSSNIFYKLSTDKEGNLWAATGKSPSRGLMKFDGKNWENYFVEKNPEIKTNGYIFVSTLDDGSVMGSSWGVGALKIDKNNNFSFYNNLNSPLTGISTDPNFVVIGNIKQAKDGTIWMVNYGETSSGPLLVAIDKNNKFYKFQNCVNENYRWFLDMVIDGNNTKWVASTLSGGLFYFNENNTLENTQDDICGNITTASYPNLSSNQQNCLAIDKNDILWIGTSYGLSSIFNTSAVLLNQKPIVRNVKLLSNQVVTGIYVDPVDNKWVATNDGVWVLNPDATEVITIINNTNSPLQDNIILSIAGDDVNGKVYIGTNNGLYEVSTLNVQPFANYNIQCYPQPFNLKKDINMVIDGLATNSDVMITTISGKLIKRFSTNSRKILWDGTDELGSLVSSGIYLVYSQSRTGSLSSVQKIAIIND